MIGNDGRVIGLRRIWRLLLYVRPYALYSLVSVVLMAVVGAMAAFRILLVKPIFDNVLEAGCGSGRRTRLSHSAHRARVSICTFWCRTIFTTRGL